MTTVGGPGSADLATDGGRRARRNAARRRWAAASRVAHQAEYDELRVALGHWLTTDRVDALGRVIAQFVADYRSLHGSSPAWGEILSGSAVLARLPFLPPDDLPSIARQQWRNVKFATVMEACRGRGCIVYGRVPTAPGPRWRSR